MIINNFNIWQRVVAKHCPITALPLTTNPHPRRCRCPSRMPARAKRGRVHCQYRRVPLPSSRDVGKQHATSPPESPPPRRSLPTATPTAMSPLTQPAYATSPPPPTATRPVTAQKQRVRHVTDDDDPHTRTRRRN